MLESINTRIIQNIEIARKNNIAIVEDAAQSLGSTLKGKQPWKGRVGSHPILL